MSLRDFFSSLRPLLRDVDYNIHVCRLTSETCDLDVKNNNILVLRSISVLRIRAYEVLYVLSLRIV